MVSVPLRIFNIIAKRQDKPALLLLQSLDAGALLPIWVGPAEGMAINLALHGVRPARPLTHNLMAAIIQKMGGTLVSVEITDIKEGTFFAVATITKAGATLQLDCRPSDAIALALQQDTPIFARSRVLLQADHNSHEQFTFDEIDTLLLAAKLDASNPSPENSEKVPSVENLLHALHTLQQGLDPEKVDANKLAAYLRRCIAASKHRM